METSFPRDAHLRYAYPDALVPSLPIAESQSTSISVAIRAAVMS